MEATVIQWLDAKAAHFSAVAATSSKQRDSESFDATLAIPNMCGNATDSATDTQQWILLFYQTLSQHQAKALRASDNGDDSAIQGKRRAPYFKGRLISDSLHWALFVSAITSCL
ncbi:hypothetical protein BaRGS_00023692 [Batillaria attramentaria]|uniref:Uncharacterized protein n=1 Tax=Batillaria attramentaria TaxID=370345 RepID=A0ABD0KD51_9CAEN